VRRDWKNAKQTWHRFFGPCIRVIVGIIAGVIVGIVYPHAGEGLKPLGDIFIKLTRMMIAPIIHFHHGSRTNRSILCWRLLLAIQPQVTHITCQALPLRVSDQLWIYIDNLGLICYLQGVSLWKFVKKLLSHWELLLLNLCFPE
jgi:hypothetical protein